MVERIVTAIMIMALGITPLTAATETLKLVNAGKSDFAIMLPDTPIPSEESAAKELQSHIRKISGVELPIRAGTEKLPPRAILLGSRETSQHVAKVATDVTSKRLGEDGFIIQVTPSYVVIGGGRPRGTMYGVYSLLEDDLGCRWFAADESRIPKSETIEIALSRRREIPAFEYREPFYTEAWDKDWAARNRCNGHYPRLDEETGGKIAYYPWAHSFDNLIDPKDYATSHPEYFSEIDGIRKWERTQLCLTNPDVISISKKKVENWIRRRPEVKMVSISQNDWYGPCMCVECKKVFDQTGSHSGQMLTFVNDIARHVAAEHPDKLIDTLAYQYTEKPPKNIVPEKNVRVRLAPIDNCFAHPIDACPNNKKAFKNLKAWSRITENLYIWHYNTNFSNYVMPFPDFDELQGTTRAYRKMGVKGIFFQGAYSKGGGGELAELRSWVLSKILWNPKRDVWPLVDEFLAGYYGKAGGPLRQYMGLLHNAVRDENIHFKIYQKPTEVGYLRRDLVDKSEKLFQQAEEAVAGEAVKLERVQKARLAIDYVRYMQATEENEKKKYAEILRNKIARFGYTEMSEGRPVAEFLKSLGN